ncbi:NUDIX domain-containing protein [Streptomyces sp. NPDC020883]|uniref:NUDIX domain-containing protein n=1 Tax=Streptomyces sp. NPDC020883 TaxID=3365099 RepID=UPI0037A29A93
MTDSWQTIARLAGRLEDHSTLPREQRILLQLLKIQEEAGEVAEAVIGALGQNPRKGHSHTWEDVESEICDVIVTGMVALMRMNPDGAEAVLARHMQRIADDLAGLTTADHIPVQPTPDTDSAPGMSWIPREEWIKTQPEALIASCVVLLDQQHRMLLLRYGPGHPNAGKWWLPGGMVDHNEDPWAAARRELEEETGLELALSPRLIGIDHRVDVEGTGPVLDCFFFGGILNDVPTVRLSPEHDEHAFLAPTELSDSILAARAKTLTALHAAVSSESCVCLREGLPV